MAKKLTKEKAKEILKDGEAKGHKLTKKQKAFFGARAGGLPIKKKATKKKSSSMKKMIGKHL